MGQAIRLALCFLGAGSRVAAGRLPAALWPVPYFFM